MSKASSGTFFISTSEPSSPADASPEPTVTNEKEKEPTTIEPEKGVPQTLRPENGAARRKNRRDFGGEVIFGSAKHSTYASRPKTRVGAGIMPAHTGDPRGMGPGKPPEAYVSEKDLSVGAELQRDRTTLPEDIARINGLADDHPLKIDVAKGLSRLHGDDNINRVDDTWKKDPKPPRLLPGEKEPGNTLSGQKRKRYVSQEKAWSMQTEMTPMNLDAFLKADEYATLLDTLERARSSNPYIKYAALVADTLGLPTNTFIAKPMTNDFIRMHKKQIDDNLRTINKLSRATQGLHREHVFDGMKVSVAPQVAPGTDPERWSLDTFLTKRLPPPDADEDDYHPRIYDKKTDAIPDQGPTVQSQRDTIDPDNFVTNPLHKDRIYKSYDINIENEYAKEQIAALMTQVLENVNILKAMELTYTTRNRKSYEEVLTLGLRVQTECVMEMALSYAGRDADQRYPRETDPRDFTTGKEQISEICEYTIQDSRGRAILATALVAHKNRTKINTSSSSQSRMKRMDVYTDRQEEIKTLARFISSNRSALQRTHSASGYGASIRAPMLSAQLPPGVTVQIEDADFLRRLRQERP